jgi:hypothetical protein
MKSQDIRTLERMLIKTQKNINYLLAKVRKAKKTKIQGRPVITGFDITIDGKFYSKTITY